MAAGATVYDFGVIAAGAPVYDFGSPPAGALQLHQLQQLSTGSMDMQQAQLSTGMQQGRQTAQHSRQQTGLTGDGYRDRDADADADASEAGLELQAQAQAHEVDSSVGPLGNMSESRRSAHSF